MRIIAGKYRSRKLATLPGLKTRPTLDHVKEAIFSSLGNYLTDLVTLDVFGGSGALSLESLSRGAKQAYIIEQAYDALKIIKQNAASLGVKEELVILPEDYRQVLPRLKGQKFDVVFLDPPFRMKVIDSIIAFLIANDMVSEDGFIVAEYPKEDVVNQNYPGWKVKLCRRYASSEVLILQKGE